MSDDAFADYRRGLETGVMTSATPNVMRHCLDEIERLRQELADAQSDREKQLEITYQYREQRDRLYGCCCNAIPCEDRTMDTYDSEIGRGFQETIQKAMKRHAATEQELAAAQTANTELASRIHEVDAARTERIAELEKELAEAQADSVMWMQESLKLNKQLAEARAALQRVLTNIDLWSVLGTHRNCSCKACEGLRQIAMRPHERREAGSDLDSVRLARTAALPALHGYHERT